MVALHSGLADVGAVAALQVSEDPFSAGVEDFGVITAGSLIFDHDLVGRGTSDINRSSGGELEDVGPFGVFPNYQIGAHSLDISLVAIPSLKVANTFESST